MFQADSKVPENFGIFKSTFLSIFELNSNFGQHQSGRGIKELPDLFWSLRLILKGFGGKRLWILGFSLTKRVSEISRTSTWCFSQNMNYTGNLVNIKLVEKLKMYNFGIWSLVQNLTDFKLLTSELLGNFWHFWKVQSLWFGLISFDFFSKFLHISSKSVKIKVIRFWKLKNFD